MGQPNIVMTGVSSFTGCHIARALANSGFAVTGIISHQRDAYEPYRAARLRWIADAGVECVTLNLEMSTELRTLLQTQRPHFFVHHAAWTHENHLPTYDRVRGDRLGTDFLQTLYPVLAEIGTARLLLTGTAAEYANGAHAHVETENAPPDTPYGLTKFAATQCARECAHRFALPTRVLRIFMPFGPFESPEKLISTAVHHLQRGIALPLSPCELVRDFVAAEDIGNGYVAALTHWPPAQGFDIINLCSGHGTSVRAFLTQLATTLRTDPALLQFGKNQSRTNEPPILIGNPDRAKSILAWAAPLPEPLTLNAEPFKRSP